MQAVCECIFLTSLKIRLLRKHSVKSKLNLSVSPKSSIGLEAIQKAKDEFIVPFNCRQ